jgi:cysteine protease ATG4
LDPHVCQAAVPRTEDVYTEHEAASYHCASPRKISIDRIDPCMLLGFFFSTQQEFDAFYASIQQACVFSLD